MVIGPDTISTNSTLIDRFQTRPWTFDDDPHFIRRLRPYVSLTAVGVFLRTDAARENIINCCPSFSSRTAVLTTSSRRPPSTAPGHDCYELSAKSETVDDRRGLSSSTGFRGLRDRTVIVRKTPVFSLKNCYWPADLTTRTYVPLPVFSRSFMAGGIFNRPSSTSRTYTCRGDVDESWLPSPPAPKH